MMGVFTNKLEISARNLTGEFIHEDDKQDEKRFTIDKFEMYKDTNGNINLFLDLTSANFSIIKEALQDDIHTMKIDRSLFIDGHIVIESIIFRGVRLEEFGIRLGKDDITIGYQLKFSAINAEFE